MTTDLDNAKYVSFTSYKKDGTAVSSAVWIVPFEGGYAFTTDPTSFKVKRITRDPRAVLRVCDARGKVREGATEYMGAAVALFGDDADPIAELVKQKYRIGWALLGVLAAWKKLTGKGSTATAECAIKVTLHS